MRSSERKSIFLLVLMLIVLLFNNFIDKVYKNTNITNLIFWFVSFSLAILLLKIGRDRHSHIKDIVQIIVIYNVAYIVLTYVLGLVFGYYRNIYSLEIMTILKNVIPTFILILFQELLRFIIVSKNNNKFVFFLIVVVFTLFNTIINLGSYDLSQGMDIFGLVAGVIIPNIITNSLLTFVTFKCGFMPSLIYKTIFDLYIYLVPIFPDFGVYIESILHIVYPTLLFLRLNTLLGKKTFKVCKKNSILKFVIGIPSTCAILVLIALVSGIFKFYSIAIGSNSMLHAIAKGDVVIIEKLEEGELEKLEVGDVLAYHHDNKRIVHRIIKIRMHNDKLVFNTKGDNNEQQDRWDIETSDVLGVVRFKIPYAGYPSVWLSEALK